VAIPLIFILFPDSHAPKYVSFGRSLLPSFSLLRALLSSVPLSCFCRGGGYHTQRQWPRNVGEISCGVHRSPQGPQWLHGPSDPCLHFCTPCTRAVAVILLCSRKTTLIGCDPLTGGGRHLAISSTRSRDIAEWRWSSIFERAQRNYSPGGRHRCLSRAL